MNTHEITTPEALRLLGFDVKFQTMSALSVRLGMLQITDSTGITFYMPETATLDECLARYEIKKQQFKQATT